MSKYVAMALCILLGLWAMGLMIGGNGSIQEAAGNLMQKTVDAQKIVP